MEYQKFIPEGWENSKNYYSADELKKAYYSGEVIQGYVDKCDENYNLHINLGNDIKGFISREDVDALNFDQDGLVKSNICKNKANTFIQFKVKEIKSDNEFLLTRKKVEEDAINWVKNYLQPGMIVNGIVRNIRKYGAFVDIGGGIVGLLHIEDISISRIKTPEERFFIGQKIKVMIKSIDKDLGKVILSYKELLGDWNENIKDFQEKMIVDGIVKEADKYKNGIFIELKPNLVGLAEYQEGFNYGQKVKVFIKRIIQDKKKIKLIIV